VQSFPLPAICRTMRLISSSTCNSRIGHGPPSPLLFPIDRELVLEASSLEELGESRRSEYEVVVVVFVREVVEWLE
jgi:hypothetical protein